MRLIGLHVAIVFVAAQVLSQETPSNDEISTVEVDFTGEWATDFGVLQLTQEGEAVEGRYRLGTVKGTVKDRVLTLRYTETNATGVARFTISADGSSFMGTWREDGAIAWLRWNGRRVESKPLGFDGLWATSFGLMRLTSEDSKVRGAYDYPNGVATIEGEIKDGRLIFRYQETDAAGSGWFELSDDKQLIRGKWRPDGRAQWQPWTGARKSPRKGRVWLLVLEANWEQSIEEREYAFGDMLDSYFTMASARHVDVRHRFFHDAKDLKRFCSKVQFLAEPVVVLISTHGTPEGITVFGETITADVIAESLVGASNVKLLHLSGCAMMSGKFPNQIHDSLKENATFPISGYKTNVAWDASALGDFTFLSLLLIRGLEPEEAARQAIAVSPYLGEKRLQGSAFKPLGLTVLQPPPRESAE